MKKLFISHPMRGKTNKQIIAERGRLQRIAEQVTGENMIPIDSFFKYNRTGNRVVDLGRSIELLGTADLVIFGAGWEMYDGCCIENEVCRHYCIPTIYDKTDDSVEMTQLREATIWREQSPHTEKRHRWTWQSRK